MFPREALAASLEFVEIERFAAAPGGIEELIDAVPERFDRPLSGLERRVTEDVSDAGASEPIELLGSGRFVVGEGKGHAGFGGIIFRGTDAEIFGSGSDADEGGEIGASREEADGLGVFPEDLADLTAGNTVEDRIGEDRDITDDAADIPEVGEGDSQHEDSDKDEGVGAEPAAQLIEREAGDDRDCGSGDDSEPSGTFEEREAGEVFGDNDEPTGSVEDREETEHDPKYGEAIFAKSAEDEATECESQREETEIEVGFNLVG